MKASDKNNILAMFEELKLIIDEFDSIDNPKLLDYKGLLEDIKETIDICDEEIAKDKNKTYSRKIEKDYESRTLPIEQYARARTMLRRIKSDKAKYERFKMDNNGKDKTDYVFVGVTKEEIVNIKKDLKLLTVLFETDLKDYKHAYEKIFLEGMSLANYSKQYLDGNKKTAENLCNKIYRMVAQELKISDLMFNYNVGLPAFKNKRNKVLAKMEQELVSNAILNNLEFDRPEGYFESMRDAYIEICNVKDRIDDDGNFV